MILSRLQVRTLRNIKKAEISPSPGLNLIVGDNGSGKTSLLEAIFLVGHGRSFRSNKISNIVNSESNSLIVFAEISDLGSHHRVGIQKSKDDSNEIHIDGRPTKSSSLLANILPTTLITPESFQLIADGPQYRRLYLDWLLFHVKPNFHQSWSNYQRVLKQRNALLRTNASSDQLRSWNEALTQYGDEVDVLRLEVVPKVIERVKSYAADMNLNINLEFGYRRGWRKGLSLSEAVLANESTDRKLGYTTVGPHRADLRISIDRSQAGEILSRGQQKLLVCAMKLSQMQLLTEHSGRNCIVLIDDLAAELDKYHRDKMLELLAGLEVQTFITATDSSLFNVGAWKERKVFHVKHGNPHEVV